MNFYFTYAQTPELSQLTLAQRDAVHRMAWHQLRASRPQLWLRSFTVIVAGAATGCGVGAALNHAFSLGIPASWGSGIGAGVGALLHIHMMATILRPYYERIVADCTPETA